MRATTIRLYEGPGIIFFISKMTTYICANEWFYLIVDFYPAYFKVISRILSLSLSLFCLLFALVIDLSFKKALSNVTYYLKQGNIF